MAMCLSNRLAEHKHREEEVVSSAERNDWFAQGAVAMGFPADTIEYQKFRQQEEALCSKLLLLPRTPC
jgi:hypothetical protein